MENQKEITGKMQGSAYYCPNNHIMMVLSGSGSVNITAKCVTAECEHYGIYYEIILPLVILKERGK